MPLLYPVLVQILLTFLVLFAMGRARIASLREGRVRMADIAANNAAYPDEVRRYGNNFSNQFETPVLFYVLVGIAIYIRATDIVMVLLAWLYVLTRFAHVAVHLTGNDVRTRFTIFLAGVVVLVVMWALIVVRLVTA